MCFGPNESARSSGPIETRALRFKILKHRYAWRSVTPEFIDGFSILFALRNIVKRQSTGCSWADPASWSCAPTQLIALIGERPHADPFRKVALSERLQSARMAHIVDVPYRSVSLYEAVWPVKAVRITAAQGA
mgnify:CR=1 FL=1